MKNEAETYSQSYIEHDNTTNATNSERATRGLKNRLPTSGEKRKG